MYVGISGSIFFIIYLVTHKIAVLYQAGIQGKENRKFDSPRKRFSIQTSLYNIKSIKRFKKILLIFPIKALAVSVSVIILQNSTLISC